MLCALTDYSQKSKYNMVQQTQVLSDVSTLATTNPAVAIADLQVSAVLQLLPAFLLPPLLLLLLLMFMACSYLSIVKQQEAATASSGQNAIIFCISGALVLAGSAITQALGIGWYMTLLAVMYLTAASLALGQILYVRSSSSGMTALSLLIKSRKGQAMPDNAETRRL